MDGQLMSSEMILSSYENQTVIFRCDSGNIHLVHKQFSICMSADLFFLYCRNVRKTLENVYAGCWDGPWVTVHYGATGICMTVDEFLQFGNTICEAINVLESDRLSNASPEAGVSSSRSKNGITLN